MVRLSTVVSKLTFKLDTFLCIVVPLLIQILILHLQALQLTRQIRVYFIFGNISKSQNNRIYTFVCIQLGNMAQLSNVFWRMKCEI